MFDIGFAELLVVCVIGLIILGPERLPKAAHTLGRWIGNIKRTFSNLQSEVEREIAAKELAEKMKDPYYRFDQGMDIPGQNDFTGENWESKLNPDNSEQTPSASAQGKTTKEPETESSKNPSDSSPLQK